MADECDRSPFERPERLTTAAVVLSTLKERVIVGTWLPGRRLSENEVARELKISRTPVREAFIELRRAGLVNIVPQFGTIVAPIDRTLLDDAQFLRETLECRTIELLAERVDGPLLATLHRLLDEQRALARAADEAGFLAADDRFHEHLVLASGRPGAWRVVKEARLQLDRIRHLAARRRTEMARIVDDHALILDRLGRHDPAGAVAAVRRHLRTILRIAEELSVERPELFRVPSPRQPPPGRFEASAARIATTGRPNRVEAREEP